VGLLVAATAGRWRFAAVGVLATFVTVYAKAGPGANGSGQLSWPVARWPWSSLRGREVAGEERTSEEQRRFSPPAARPGQSGGRDTLTSPLPPGTMEA